jgi:hypothetical protein
LEDQLMEVQKPALAPYDPTALAALFGPNDDGNGEISHSLSPFISILGKRGKRLYSSGPASTALIPPI